MDPNNKPTPSDNTNTEPTPPETPTTTPGTSVTPGTSGTPSKAPEVEVELNNDVSELGNSTLGSDPSVSPTPTGQPTGTPDMPGNAPIQDEQEAIAEGAPAVNDQVEVDAPASQPRPGSQGGVGPMEPMADRQPQSPMQQGAPSPLPDNILPTSGPSRSKGPLVLLVVVIVLAVAAAVAVYFVKK